MIIVNCKKVVNQCDNLMMYYFEVKLYLGKYIIAQSNHLKTNKLLNLLGLNCI